MESTISEASHKLGKSNATELQNTIRYHAQAAIVLELMIDHESEVSMGTTSAQVIDYSRADGKTLLA